MSRHCRYIYLHVKGEPLLHPELAGILARAAHHGLQVNLTTNGVLLPDFAALLLASPAMRQTNLSLHGYAPDTHGEMEAWVGALCDYARAAATLGRFTVFRFWTTPADGTHREQDTELLALLERRFPAVGNCFSHPASRSITLGQGIFVSFQEQFDWPGMGAPDYGAEGICYGGRTMIGILADGTVVPCCLDGDGICALGNALEQPLDDILTSPRYLALSNGFTNRHILEPLCRRCGYRLRFNKNEGVLQ